MSDFLSKCLTWFHLNDRLRSNDVYSFDIFEKMNRCLVSLLSSFRPVNQPMMPRSGFHGTACKQHCTFEDILQVVPEHLSFSCSLCALDVQERTKSGDLCHLGNNIKAVFVVIYLKHWSESVSVSCSTTRINKNLELHHFFNRLHMMASHVGCDWPIIRSCVTSSYGLSLTFMCQKTLDIVFQTPFTETSHLGWKPPDWPAPHRI